MDLPLKPILREERWGEPGSGKLGIGLDLNYFITGSIGNFERSTAPLRSVLRLKAFGCVRIFDGAELRSSSGGL